VGTPRILILVLRYEGGHFSNILVPLGILRFSNSGLSRT
jgi:hypothetical protein